MHFSETFNEVDLDALLHELRHGNSWWVGKWLEFFRGGLVNDWNPFFNAESKKWFTRQALR